MVTTDEDILAQVVSLVSRQEQSGRHHPETPESSTHTFMFKSTDDSSDVLLGWQRTPDGERWFGEDVLVHLTRFTLRCGTRITPSPGQVYEVVAGQDHGRAPLDVLAAAYSVVPHPVETPHVSGMPFFYDRAGGPTVY